MDNAREKIQSLADMLSKSVRRKVNRSIIQVYKNPSSGVIRFKLAVKKEDIHKVDEIVDNFMCRHSLHYGISVNYLPRYKNILNKHTVELLI